MANSADPDQLASSEAMKKPTDLDLHCLLKQDILGLSMTRVNIIWVLHLSRGHKLYCLIGISASDKYLSMNATGGKSKKSKKKKKKKKDEESEEEEIQAAHHVSNVVEMPEVGSNHSSRQERVSTYYFSDSSTKTYSSILNRLARHNLNSVDRAINSYLTQPCRHMYM